MTDPGTRVLAAALLRELAGGAWRAEAPRLRVLDGPRAGEALPLGPEETLGRGARATLRLPDPTASRLHARLASGPEGVRLEDLGSKNGLRLNGRPLGGPARLRPGDVVTVGATRLALEAAAAPGPAPAPRARLGAAALLLLAAAGALLAAALG